MKAMILAAGLGQRMRPLTETIPKPLVAIRDGIPLIHYSLEALREAGSVSEVWINTHAHREQMQSFFKTGAYQGLRIHLCEEEQLLGTIGGVLNILKQWPDDYFYLLSADIVSTYPLKRLPKHPQGHAHLVLVDNPAFHAEGDCCLVQGRVLEKNNQRKSYTYSNIGIFSRKFFEIPNADTLKFSSLLNKKIKEEKVSGEYFKGPWWNVGDADELARVKDFLRAHAL